MRIHKRIKNLTEPEKRQFEEYLERKLGTLTPILSAHHADPDAAHFFAEIQKHHKHTAFVFECILEVPRKRFVASETKHTITEAVDFATQRIEFQMAKHFKKLVTPPRRQRSIRAMKQKTEEQETLEQPELVV